MTDQFSIYWDDGRREPQCEPDPRYPNGIALDITRGREPFCIVSLPYPAKRCGLYVVECRICKQRVACTTAGRIDDPISIKIACELRSDTHADA
jgi:hypothetical protein